MVQQSTIEENNKLIAEFFGLKHGWWISQEKPLTDDKKQWWDIDSKTFLGSRVYYNKDLKFHSSWDWLMPVVEKIESMGFWFNIKKNHVTVARDNKGTFDSNMIHSEFGDMSKIERVYQCAVAFIKYNENKNK